MKKDLTSLEYAAIGATLVDALQVNAPDDFVEVLLPIHALLKMPKTELKTRLQSFMAGQQSYTVLLSYPDNDETFCTSVQARSVDQAIERARQEALDAQDDSDYIPADFPVLYVTLGEHPDISTPDQRS